MRATSDHPATWGYYIGDEVDPGNQAQVQELADAVRSITQRPLLYVSRPNPSKLSPFKRVADFVGPDSYPVGPIDPPVCPTARWASKMVRGAKPAKRRRAKKSSGPAAPQLGHGSPGFLLVG